MLTSETMVFGRFRPQSSPFTRASSMSLLDVSHTVALILLVLLLTNDWASAPPVEVQLDGINMPGGVYTPPPTNGSESTTIDCVASGTVLRDDEEPRFTWNIGTAIIF